MIWFSLSKAQAMEASGERPPGYVARLQAAAAMIEGDRIHLSPWVYDRLCASYRVADARAKGQPFDRVAVIAMSDSPRIATLEKRLREIGWSWPWPEWHEAVDGRRLPLPVGWHAGPGAWGCMESHRRVLEKAILDGVESLLVLEDDFTCRADFMAEASAFLAEVPVDWDQLMLGGQFVNRAGSARRLISPRVVKAWGIERTHCYAVRGEYLRALYAKWSGACGHCDHVMGPFQRDWKVYAPATFLAGQAGGLSTIAGSVKRPEFWNPPPPDAPVYWFRDREPGSGLALLNRVRGRGYHGGYDRRHGIDVGLARLARGVVKTGRRRARRMTHDEQVRALRDWLRMIQWEGQSMTPISRAAIYCPALAEVVALEAGGKNLREVFTAEDLTRG